MRECFDALRDEQEIEIHLFKGDGKNVERENRLWNLPRDGRLARACAAPLGRSGYFSEQLTFFLSLLPRLVVRSPDVVYVSDVVLANLLRMVRGPLGYRVLYCNGGPIGPELLHRWDHIQQVSPQHLDEAIAGGIAVGKQTLLPHGVGIPSSPSLPSDDVVRRIRDELRLPTDGKLLLSVGAINRSRKRMDYLIREIASLEDPPFLLMLGAREKESPEILRLADELLPNRFEARTVEKHEVTKYYQAADLFALASVDEGFGLVYVEALAHGLPCLVHDYPTSRYVLGDQGIFGDLTKIGELARMIDSLSPDEFSRAKAEARHHYAYENFSWDRLKPKYIEMFQRCATLNTTANKRSSG